MSSDVDFPKVPKVIKFHPSMVQPYIDRDELAGLILSTLAPSEILKLRGSGRHKVVSATPPTVVKFEPKQERTGSTGN